MTGWVTINREMMDHPLFKADLARAGAWIWLITHAAWKPTRFNNRGQIITLERGQLCAGRDYLAGEWGWSASAVSRFLTRLETEQMIGQQTGHGLRVVTICNYAKYQDINNGGGQQIGRQFGQQSDSNRTHIEQGNKETKELYTDTIGVLTRETQKKTKPETYEIPDWIPKIEWDGFVEMRKRNRKPMTDRAVQLAVIKLDKLRGDGHDPGQVLDQSTANGYQGLFEVKHNGSTSSTTRTFGRSEPSQPIRSAWLQATIDASNGQSVGSGFDP